MPEAPVDHCSKLLVSDRQKMHENLEICKLCKITVIHNLSECEHKRANESQQGGLKMPDHMLLLMKNW